MSGAEVIAIVACVSAVVSAYRDGTHLFRAIRKKYHERRRQSDQAARDLEWSLRRGHHEIRSQFDQHCQVLGSRYEQGDSIAREQMKDIIIQLQGAMIKHLREAQEQGTTLDMMALQFESDQGRLRTLVVLGDLYRRLSSSSPVSNYFSMSVDPTYPTIDAYGQRYYPANPDGYSSPTGPQLRDLLGGYPALQTRYSYVGYPVPVQDCIQDDRSISPTEIHDQPRDLAHASPPPRRWSSGISSVVSRMNDRLYHRDSRVGTPSHSFPSSAPESIFVTPPGRVSTLLATPPESIPELDVRPATPPCRPSTRQIARRNVMHHDELWGNPWTTGGDDEIPFVQSSEEEKAEEASHHLSPISPISPPSQPRTNSLSTPSVASTDSTHSAPSTRSSTEHPKRAIRPLWPPSNTNNYLGFCKGAWKVHTGFGGFKIHSEPGSGYYTQRSWLRCGKCSFEAPMASKTSSQNPQFEDSVRTHKRTGVRYRFEFLAKSHVPCKRDPMALFTPNNPRGAFGCVFCCARAQGSAQVYGNLDLFMAHLAEQHWDDEGGTLAVLPSTRCVIGRVALDSEYFDVNVLPMRRE